MSQYIKKWRWKVLIKNTKKGNSNKIREKVINMYSEISREYDKN